MSSWIKVDITTTTEGIEPVGAVLLELGLGYSVQDSQDFGDFLAGKNGHWDYIDEELMVLKDAPTVVTVYLSDKKQGVDQLAVITSELDRLRFLSNNDEWGRLTYSLSGVKEEDWANAWKDYYHAVEITDRLVICPQWQEYDGKAGQVVVKMDPGMAFGTGTHESTKLCLVLLDGIIKGGERVLDIGAGSGILSIAAVLLGARGGIGTDIDQVAAETAVKNSRLNKVEDRLSYRQGSFADGIDGQFDIVFANIVADAIISFAPSVAGKLTDNGYFIASGIIDERSDQVRRSLEAHQLEIVKTTEENGWVAFLAKRKK